MESRIQTLVEISYWEVIAVPPLFTVFTNILI